MSRIITGQEPNIKRCIERKPFPEAKESPVRPAEDGNFAGQSVRKERQEQKVFSAYLSRLRKAGKLYFASPQAHKASTITEGHPDYTIWLAGGFAFCIEMKAEGGRGLSAKQIDVHAELGALGHIVRVAWSAAQAEQITAFYLARANTRQPLIET